MPLYEFTCADCSHHFETLVRDEAELRDAACPSCRSARVERLLSVPARPAAAPGVALPTACNSEGPPCGAPWCRRA
ncbi:MAG TPA: zinc ribbon domain-containing protein [Gemmataceae bacterium]